MAKRKQTLQTAQYVDISLIGISCHLKSYRLSFALDNTIGFGFRRIDDFEIPGHPDETDLNFPFLIYEDIDLKTRFCLIGNHHPQGKLVPSLGQVDFFLMAGDALEQNTIHNILKKTRSIPQILAAYEIDPAKIKDMDLLFEEMELHLIIAGKEDPAE